MPIYEYTCPNKHKTQAFFLTFGKAKEHEDSIACTVCGANAARDVSVPLPAHLYGNPAGYHKPSPTKRHSYKTSMSNGNASSAG